MEPTNLSSFYADLKSRLNSDKGSTAPSKPVTPITAPGIPSSNMGASMPLDIVFHRKMINNCDKLKDDCRKHILLDIYIKILPLDDDFKCKHMGMMKNDIDCMLKNKGMNATQYLTSCSEATKAPLLEYLMRATDMIGKQYVEDATEEAKTDKENGVNTPEPKSVSVEDKDVQDQLVDVKQDPEYETFVDKLKEKTVKKIVDDVSKIIADKKDEQKMTFDIATPGGPTQQAAASEPSVDNGAVAESTVGIGIDYINKHFGSMMENVNMDDVMGISIREATLNQFDIVFRQKSGEFKEFASRIRYGHGTLINESCDLFNEARAVEKDLYLGEVSKLFTIFSNAMLNDVGKYKKGTFDEKINKSIEDFESEMYKIQSKIKVRPDERKYVIDKVYDMWMKHPGRAKMISTIGKTLRAPNGDAYVLNEEDMKMIDKDIKTAIEYSANEAMMRR